MQCTNKRTSGGRGLQTDHAGENGGGRHHGQSIQIYSTGDRGNIGLQTPVAQWAMKYILFTIINKYTKKMRVASIAANGLTSPHIDVVENS